MLVSGVARERESELSRAVCHLPRAECFDCVFGGSEWMAAECLV